MPKLIVLFVGDDNLSPAVAEAAASGARSVRFTEVDIRSATGSGGYRRLESADALAHYDAVVIAAPAGAARPDGLTILNELSRAGSMENTVLAVAGGDAALLERVVALGGILVTVHASSDDLEKARRLGGRAAKVAGWVRHSLGHEAEHHHHHDHDHDHHH